MSYFLYFLSHRLWVYHGNSCTILILPDHCGMASGTMPLGGSAYTPSARWCELQRLSCCLATNSTRSWQFPRLAGGGYSTLVEDTQRTIMKRTVLIVLVFLPKNTLGWLIGLLRKEQLSHGRGRTLQEATKKKEPAQPIKRFCLFPFRRHTGSKRN